MLLFSFLQIHSFFYLPFCSGCFRNTPGGAERTQFFVSSSSFSPLVFYFFLVWRNKFESRSTGGVEWFKKKMQIFWNPALFFSPLPVGYLLGVVHPGAAQVVVNPLGKRKKERKLKRKKKFSAWMVKESNGSIFFSLCIIYKKIFI